jgi:hypothetical protein
MKNFTMIKTAYSAGINGCSGEYFTIILSKDDGMQYGFLEGLYGVEERIRREIEAKGWKFFYTSSNWGKINLSDVNKVCTKSEDTIMESLADFL